MALSKSVALETGVITTYHKIRNVVIIFSKNGSSANIRVDSYVDQTARQLAKQPCISKNHSVKQAELELAIDNETTGDTDINTVLAKGYVFLKTLEDWSDATDC